MHSRGSHGRRLPVPAGTFGPPARKGWDHEAACCRASTSARLSGSGRPRPSSSSLFLFTCWKVYTISEGLSRGNFCGARKIHFYGGRCLLAVGRRHLSNRPYWSIRSEIKPYPGRNFRMASLLSLTGRSPIEGSYPYGVTALFPLQILTAPGKPSIRPGPGQGTALTARPAPPWSCGRRGPRAPAAQPARRRRSGVRWCRSAQTGAGRCPSYTG